MVHVSRGVLVTKILLVIHLSGQSGRLLLALLQDEVLEDVDRGVVVRHEDGVHAVVVMRHSLLR